MADRWTVSDRVGRQQTGGDIGLLAALVFLIVLAISQMPDVTNVMGCAFLFVLAAATLVARQTNAPGEDAGRPVAGRIDDGTGRVDAVRFRARTSMIWAYAVALGLWDVLAIVITVYRVRDGGAGAVVGWPVAWGALVLTVLIPVAVVVGCRTRFVAVTPGALVLAAGKRRMRIPWDDLRDARPSSYEIEGLPARYGPPRIGFSRHLVLVARKGAAPPPPDRALLRWFSATPVNPLNPGGMPTIHVDGPLGLVASRALLRAIRWHLRSPHTLEALAAGYGQGWPEPVRQGRDAGR